MYGTQHAVTSAGRAVQLGAGQDGVYEEVLWPGCSEAPQFTAVCVGQWGWTVKFGRSCTVNPWLGLQAENVRLGLSLWWKHPAALLKSDALIHIYCPGFKAHMFFLKSEHRNLANPDSNRYLISPCV